MFIVLLRFSENKVQAAQHMEAHNAWIRQGFDDGVFILVGSIQPNAGGSIFAHNLTLAQLESRVKNDPFVAENIVTVEIVEISAKKADQRLEFLLE